MYCTKCGKELEKDAKFCVNCGTPVNGETKEKTEEKKEVKQERPVNYSNYNNNSFSYMNIPYEYKPISMWGYFGYQILFAIPCIGWILLLVFALRRIFK